MSAQGRRPYPCEYDRERESTAETSSLADLWSASKHVARAPSWRSLRDRDRTTTVRTTPAVACAPGESHQAEQPADPRPGTQARPCPNDDCDALASHIAIIASNQTATIAVRTAGATSPVAKSLSRGDLAGFERHAVPQRFELSNEPLGEAIGVLAGEVVAAEIVV